jgi:hypothetical protein
MPAVARGLINMKPAILMCSGPTTGLGAPREQRGEAAAAAPELGRGYSEIRRIAPIW